MTPLWRPLGVGSDKSRARQQAVSRSVTESFCNGCRAWRCPPTVPLIPVQRVDKRFIFKEYQGGNLPASCWQEV
jgi:hypothetical protein